MEDPLYREVILENWQHPANYGTLQPATVDATGFNPLCGDKIHLTVVIKDGVVSDIAFTSEGCAISTASASLFTDYIKGWPLARIRKLTEQDVFDQLGIELTPARTKCALLVLKTLQKSPEFKPAKAV